MLEDGIPTVLAEHSLTDPFAHAEQLIPLLHCALADAGRRLQDAQAVVVGLGPGPFTGLRVGIASAAALGDGLDIQVHGVPSHGALAAGISGDVLVVTDARRREVYVSAYREGMCIGPDPVASAGVARWLVARPGVRPIGAGRTRGRRWSTRCWRCRCRRRGETAVLRLVTAAAPDCGPALPAR